MPDAPPTPAAGQEGTLLTPEQALIKIREYVELAHRDGIHVAGDAVLAVIRSVRRVEPEATEAQPAERAAGLRDAALELLELGSKLDRSVELETGTIRDLAESAHHLDCIARAGAEDLSPIALNTAAALLERAAVAFGSVIDVQGRFARADEPEPDMTTPGWQPARILPEGFEDLNPQDLARAAERLRGRG